MREATNQPTSRKRKSPLPFEIVDLTTHPDGQLLRLIAEATVMRDRPGVAGWKLKDFIDIDDQIGPLEPATRFGLHAKALYALGNQDRDLRVFGLHGVAFSVIEDAMRMGLML
jgi:hypothetical protein